MGKDKDLKVKGESSKRKKGKVRRTRENVQAEGSKLKA